ncbi:MAG TPA: tetratricopeptide repeat protein [Candidatus Melainabacteria bacterium]|nr:tetratricopeptide repeat protein [Candidatus Melainabacteria bacterium]
MLANALRQQGRYREALGELEIALPVLKTGSEKSLLATATNNLGALYFWMGDYQKALPILQDGLNQRLQVCGENHPDVANSYLDLGCVEFKIGDLKNALEHLEEAHEIRTSKMGANHPETLSSAANLAVVLLATCDKKRALELLKDAVEAGKTVLGNKNPDLAQYKDDYANALCADKQFDLARDTQTEANLVRKAVFGGGSREYANGLRSLAQIESASGNQKSARQLIEKSIAIYRASAQRPDPDLADAMDELGCMYVQGNDLESARQTFVLAVREKLKVGNSVSYATSLANLAELLHRMKQDAESQVMLKKAAEAIQSLPQTQRENPDCKAILERYAKAQNGSAAGDR